MNKTTIIYLIMVLIIIWAFGYMAYGEEELPTPKEIALQQRARLLAEQEQINKDNFKIRNYCNEYASGATADEMNKSFYDCYRLQKIPNIDIPSIETNSWTSTASTVAVPEHKQINLRSIFWLGDCRFTNDNHKLPRYNLEWLAYDIACEKWKAFDVSVPNYQAKEGRNWIVEKIGYGHNMGNFIIIKSNTLRVVYGHTKPIEWIKEWDIVKSTFTIGETDLSGESTWMHLHLEIWEWTDIVSRERFWSPTWEKQDQRKLLEHRKWDFGQKKKILRDGQELEALTYTWNKYGDIDFIKTIEAESRWDGNALWDAGDAYGYCQINKNFNPDMQTEYRNLKTYQQRIDYCYGQYKTWVDKGIIHKRLYGYNVRNLPQNNKFTFQ